VSDQAARTAILDALRTMGNEADERVDFVAGSVRAEAIGSEKYKDDGTAGSDARTFGERSAASWLPAAESHLVKEVQVTATDR
jgi:hypothetical protein